MASASRPLRLLLPEEGELSKLSEEKKAITVLQWLQGLPQAIPKSSKVRGGGVGVVCDRFGYFSLSLHSLT